MIPLLARSSPAHRSSVGRGGPASSHGTSWVGFTLDAVLHAYSQVIFARSRWIGLLLFLASFIVPEVGLVGLMGVLISGGLAMLLQLDREAVRSGVLGYNALLVFLGIGALFAHTPAFWALAAATTLLVVLTHVALAGVLARLRLPVLSVPFVLTLWLVISAVPHIRGLAFINHHPALDLGAFPGPVFIDGFLRSLGAIFFQPHWTAGVLVFAALFTYSRVATVHALIGFAVAMVADTWLLTFPPDVFHVYVGFNIVLTSVALGGIFYVPSPSSLALSAAGALVAALVSVGVLAALQPLGLPVLAAPLNLVVLLTLYALALRTRASRPRVVDFVQGSPEQNLAWF
ncbi:MAG: urea transporter, partial [Kiritimatiellia bacterium]